MAEQKNISWKIYWTDYTTGSYLYGSEITFHDKNHVEFENKLMPPGTVINSWYSRTNFQSQKIEPSLSIIDGEIKYKICANIDTENASEILIRLVYFDRYGEEIGNDVITGLIGEFQCPLRTYSYELQLISGGVTRMDFHSIIIQEVPDEDNSK